MGHKSHHRISHTNIIFRPLCFSLVIGLLWLFLACGGSSGGPDSTAAPSVATPAESVVEIADGTDFTYQVIAESFSENALAYSLIVAPDGMEISGDGVITWKPQDQIGTHTVIVQVTTDRRTSTVQFTVKVSLVAEITNNPPVFAAVSPQAANIGEEFIFNITATDNDANDRVIAYILVDPPFSTMSIDTNGKISGWTPVAADAPGTYDVKVKAIDSYNAVGTVTFQVYINNSPSVSGTLNIEVSVDDEFTYQITATDVDTATLGDTLSYIIESSPDSRIKIDANGRFYGWTPTTSDGPATYPLQVRIEDNNGGHTQVTYNLRVNLRPSVTIDSFPSDAWSNITFSYTLKDTESDTCYIEPFYSIDGGVTFLPATKGTGGEEKTGLTSSYFGVAHTFVWDSNTDLGITPQANVVFKIIPYDTSSYGSSATTAVFAVDNLRGRVELTQPAGIKDGDVTITYKAYYGLGTPLNIKVDFSVDGGIVYNPATEGVGGDGTTNITTGVPPNGEEHTYVWDSLTDLGFNLESAIRIRITLLGVTNTAGATENFTVNNSVELELVSPLGGGGEQFQGDVVIEYTWRGPSAGGNITDMTFEYSLVSDAGPWIACSTRNVNIGNDPAIAQQPGPRPTGRRYSFAWDTMTDLPANNDTVWIKAYTPTYLGGYSVTSGVFKIWNRGLSEMSPWPKKFGYSIENHQKSRYNGPATPAVAWSNGPVWTNSYIAPVIGTDGTIYIAGRNTAGQYGLFALNPEDGSQKWFYECFAEWPRTTPAIGNGNRIYYLTRVLGGAYQLLCLTDTGAAANLNWAYTVDNYFEYMADPTIDPDGTIYFTSRNAANQYGISAVTDNGAAAVQKWFYFHASYPTYPKTMPSINVSGNRLNFGERTYRNVYGIRRDTGAYVWNGLFTYNYKGTPTLFNGKLYFTDGYYIRRRNSSDGGSDWSWVWCCWTDDYAYMTPAITHNNLIMYNRYNGSSYRYIRAWNESMSNVWTYTDPNYFVRNYFAVCPDNTFFVRAGLYLRKISTTSGTAISGWDNSVNLGQNQDFTGVAIGADENLYIPCRNDQDSFRRYGAQLPVIQNIWPSGGTNFANTKLKIFGGNFLAVAGTVSVKLKNDTTEVDLPTFTVDNYSNITATVPIGATPGTYNIIVTTTNGANTTSNATYTVTP